MSDYQSNANKGTMWGGSSHALIRAVSIFCLTAFLITAMFMLFAYNGDRFSIVSSDQGLYIFDRKSVDLSYCTSDGKCITTAIKRPELPPMMEGMQGDMQSQPMGMMTPPPAPSANPQDIAYCQAVMQNNGGGNASWFGGANVPAQMNAAQQFVNNTQQNRGYAQTAFIPAPFQEGQQPLPQGASTPQDQGGILPTTSTTSSQGEQQTAQPLTNSPASTPSPVPNSANSSTALNQAPLVGTLPQAQTLSSSATQTAPAAPTTATEPQKPGSGILGGPVEAHTSAEPKATGNGGIDDLLGL